jgi:hypothetical protein
VAKKSRSGRDYEVGKGRPPKASRWKPGQSGNPKGRPKGVKNAATQASAELGRTISVTVNGRKRRMTVEEVAFRRLGDKSMAGDQKAFGFLLVTANRLDPADLKPADDMPTNEQDLSIISDYVARHGGKRDE